MSGSVGGAGDASFRQRVETHMKGRAVKAGSSNEGTVTRVAKSVSQVVSKSLFKKFAKEKYSYQDGNPEERISHKKNTGAFRLYRAQQSKLQPTTREGRTVYPSAAKMIGQLAVAGLKRGAKMIAVEARGLMSGLVKGDAGGGRAESREEDVFAAWHDSDPSGRLKFLSEITPATQGELATLEKTSPGIIGKLSVLDEASLGGVKKLLNSGGAARLADIENARPGTLSMLAGQPGVLAALLRVEAKDPGTVLRPMDSGEFATFSNLAKTQPESLEYVIDLGLLKEPDTFKEVASFLTQNPQQLSVLNDRMDERFQTATEGQDLNNLAFSPLGAVVEGGTHIPEPGEGVSAEDFLKDNSHISTVSAKSGNVEVEGTVQPKYSLNEAGSLWGADFVQVTEFKGGMIATLADGSGNKKPSLDGAKHLTASLTDNLTDSLNQVQGESDSLGVADIQAAMKRAITKSILLHGAEKNSGRASECTAAVTLTLNFGDRTFAFGFNMGDTGTFIQKENGEWEIPSAGSVTKSTADNGGAFGASDLHTKTANDEFVRFFCVELGEGDKVVMGSDGIQDNLEPRRLGLSPQGAAKQVDYHQPLPLGQVTIDGVKKDESTADSVTAHWEKVKTFCIETVLQFGNRPDLSDQGKSLLGGLEAALRNKETRPKRLQRMLKTIQEQAGELGESLTAEDQRYLEAPKDLWIVKMNDAEDIDLQGINELIIKTGWEALEEEVGRLDVMREAISVLIDADNVGQSLKDQINDEMGRPTPSPKKLFGMLPSELVNRDPILKNARMSQELRAVFNGLELKDLPHSFDPEIACEESQACSLTEANERMAKVNNDFMKMRLGRISKNAGSIREACMATAKTQVDRKVDDVSVVVTTVKRHAPDVKE